MDRSFLMRVTLFIALNCFTVRVSCEQQRCRGRGRSCGGQFTDAKAVCRGGYCYCTGKDYDYNTCLRKLIPYCLMFYLSNQQTIGSIIVICSVDPLHAEYEQERWFPLRQTLLTDSLKSETCTSLTPSVKFR
jgi:hypothetical protein